MFSRAVLVSVSLLMCGLAMAVFLGLWAYEVETDRVDGLFYRNAINHATAVSHGLRTHVETVRVMANFFAASDDVTRRDFRAFSESLLERNPGTQALEWIPKLRPVEVDEVLRRAQREVPGYRLHDLDDAGTRQQVATREAVFLVLYAEPQEENRLALGEVIAGDNEQAQTLRRAILEGAPHLSQPTTVAVRQERESILRAFMPVYRHGLDLVTPDDRERAAAGVICGLFSLRELVEEAVGKLEPAGLNLELWTGTTTRMLVHQHMSRFPLRESALRSTGGQSYESSFVVGGRQWHIMVRAQDGYYMYEWLGPALLAATAGLLSVVLAVFSGVILRREREVRELVARRTEELSYQATHDALTGLINRSEFERLLDEVIDRCANDHEVATLAYLDLDQFKVVNDTCGHGAGDQLLRELAQLLRSAVRSADTLARLGGDEFGLLLYGCDARGARGLASKILDRIGAHRFNWKNNIFAVGASIGIVQLDRDTESAATVMSQADAACYLAKENGRGRFHIHAPGSTETDMFRREMEWVAVIRRALEKNWFVLRQQPIHSTAELHRPPWFFEVLLTLKTPDGELVPPGAFLPAAERFELISEVDRWVVRRVLHHLANGAGDTDALWAINLSGQTLADPSFAEEVIVLIEKAGVSPHQLCFEITETAVISRLDIARRFIDRLRSVGCRFSLDDFGSGMSSFSYLKHLPVDFVKIDGAFIRGLGHDEVDRVMVRSIHQIARVAGMRTVAECVETESVLNALNDLGIDFVQGFHVGMPGPFAGMPAGNIVKIG